MATEISKKEARKKISDTILQTAGEMVTQPSKKLKKAVKSASKKIGKALKKDLRHMKKVASKAAKKQKPARQKKKLVANEPEVLMA